MIRFITFWRKLYIHKESGLALIQVLLMATMLAGAVSFSVLQNSKTTQKVSHDIYSQDLRLLVDRIQSVLANQPDCTDIISLTAGFSTLATGTSISPTALIGTTLGTFLTETDAGTLIPRYGSQEKISLTDITIARTSDTLANLTLNFRIDDQGVLGIREFAKVIPLVVIGTAATVTSCHADPDDLIADTMKRFCQGPGAILDPITNQCFLIGFNARNCLPGEFVKGVTYDPATMMVTPLCAPISGLTYDTTGCVAKAGVPIGFDASGNIVCDKMISRYIWSLAYFKQQDMASENCTTRIAKLRVAGSNFSVNCQQPTVTPTPTNTFTPTNTPSWTAVATNTNTPTAAPTTITATPTYTSTPSTPTATPTEEPPNSCVFTGDPYVAYSSYNRSSSGPTMQGTVKEDGTDYDVGWRCHDNTKAYDDVEFVLDGNMPGNFENQTAYTLNFTNFNQVSCSVGYVVVSDNSGVGFIFNSSHGHAHFAGVAHNHCRVDTYLEHDNNFAFFENDTTSIDAGIGSVAAKPCLTNTNGNAPAAFRVKARFTYDSSAGSVMPAECATDCNQAQYNFCSSNGSGCCNTDFKLVFNELQIYFSADGGSTWKKTHTITQYDLNEYCGGTPSNVFVDKVGGD